MRRLLNSLLKLASILAIFNSCQVNIEESNLHFSNFSYLLKSENYSIREFSEGTFIIENKFVSSNKLIEHFFFNNDSVLTDYVFFNVSNGSIRWKGHYGNDELLSSHGKPAYLIYVERHELVNFQEMKQLFISVPPLCTAEYSFSQINESTEVNEKKVFIAEKFQIANLHKLEKNVKYLVDYKLFISENILSEDSIVFQN